MIKGFLFHIQSEFSVGISGYRIFRSDAAWGAFYSTQNSGNFGLYIKWNWPFRFGPSEIFGTSFEGGPLWPVRLSRSVGLKYLFPFDKIVVSSTTLLYPAYKNINNQTRGG